MSKSCARNAGFGFLMIKYLGSGWLKSISSRDLMVEIMDWNDDVERFKDIDVYGYSSGTKSLEI